MRNKNKALGVRLSKKMPVSKTPEMCVIILIEELGRVSVIRWPNKNGRSPQQLKNGQDVPLILDGNELFQNPGQTGWIAQTVLG